MLCIKCVSIHATLAGGDVCSYRQSAIASMFLSTPPSRVATGAVRPPWRSQQSFYPRHPRGWRRLGVRPPRAFILVSIHATLAGGDKYWFIWH